MSILNLLLDTRTDRLTQVISVIIVNLYVTCIEKPINRPKKIYCMNTCKGLWFESEIDMSVLINLQTPGCCFRPSTKVFKVYELVVAAECSFCCLLWYSHKSEMIMVF